MSITSRGNRRRLAVPAVLASAALVVLSTASPSTAAPTCGKSIAYMGPLSGSAAPLGGNMMRGAQLAIEKYNQAHPGCTVTFKKFDTQGDPTKAPSKATQIINDPTVIGVVGPAFSGETLATGKTFFESDLPTITPSATNPLTSAQGWTTFHRLLASDTTGAPLVAKYIGANLGGTRVALVVDDSDYGRTVVRAVRTALGSKAVLTTTVRTGQTNFSSTVHKVIASKPKVVFYGGYYPEAGLLAKQLTLGGYGGKIVGGDGMLDPIYAKLAGPSATSRTFIPTGVAPPTLNKTFFDVFKARFQKAPGLYSLESRDAANVFLAGLDAGVTTPAEMGTFVNTYDRAGLTKQIKFSTKGELTHQVLWVYKLYKTSLVVKGKIQ